MDIDIEKRVKYKIVEADIIGVGTEENIAYLTLYSDKAKIQTNIFLDEKGIEQVINLLGNAVGRVPRNKIEVLPGYQ